MLVQSSIHFALDYVIQSACHYFEVSISSNKVWGTNVLAATVIACTLETTVLNAWYTLSSRYRISTVS